MHKLTYEVTWPAAGTTSAAINIDNKTPVGLRTPSTFTSTSITFSESEAHNGTFRVIKDETGTAITYTVTTNSFYRLKPSDFAGAGPFIKVIGGSSEAEGREVEIVARDFK